MKSFEVIHHQRAIKIYLPDEDRWIGFKFDADAWERLIRELNNPPDIGVEVSEGTTISETIAGN